MKTHFLIFIFCFSYLFFNAQYNTASKINFPVFDSLSSKNKLNFSYSQYSNIAPYSQYPGSSISIKTDLPKLPFFCGMEEKFRNKFNVFLKVRAGNDESYMNMIKSPNK